MSLTVITPGSARFSFLYKFLEIPFLDEFFNLFLQVLAVFSVMAMVFVEVAVLPFLSHTRR